MDQDASTVGLGCAPGLSGTTWRNEKKYLIYYIFYDFWRIKIKNGGVGVTGVVASIVIENSKLWPQNMAVKNNHFAILYLILKFENLK